MTVRKALPTSTAAKTRRHILRVSKASPATDRDLARCRDCEVSCQSACKTSCTVGNQRCPK